jgi:hypothetical protein
MRPLEVVILDVLPELLLGFLEAAQRRLGQALLDHVAPE